MTIQNCSSNDLPQIVELYNAARNLQKERKMVVWPPFEPEFLLNEIAEGRQWKITDEDLILCNWAVTFGDKEIWENKDKNDAIYIHRICTHPGFRGNRYIDKIVEWAKSYGVKMGKAYIRLDTLGNNLKLIKHYTLAGFEFLGIFRLSDTSTLPIHYQEEPNCCLFEIRLNQESNLQI